MTTIIFNTEITYNGMDYPRWLIAIGWGSCILSIICIPIYFVYKLSKMNGSLKKVGHLNADQVNTNQIEIDHNPQFICSGSESRWRQTIGDRLMRVIERLGKQWFEILKKISKHKFDKHLHLYHMWFDFFIHVTLSIVFDNFLRSLIWNG